VQLKLHGLQGQALQWRDWGGRLYPIFLHRNYWTYSGNPWCIVVL